MTPLASIIGSGFLVVAPLLYNIVNNYSVLAILAIVCFAYVIGSVLRHNIYYVEPLLEQPTKHRFLFINEQFANLTLSLAYIVSVAFYLRLMSSFLLDDLNFNGEMLENLLTSIFLIIILITGLVRGLTGLEFLERIAVNVKLSIIAVLIIALIFYDFSWLGREAGEIVFKEPEDNLLVLRQLAGALLIVQGFETCRYLGNKYSAELRISAMKIAQLISAAIYFIFILLSAPLMLGLESTVSETAIIDISSRLAFVLPFLLVIAAVMSQASASIADTVGAGGLAKEASRGWVSQKVAYAAVCAISIMLIWTINIFQIISLSSQMFALYYAIQCFSALIVIKLSNNGFYWKACRIMGVGTLGLILLLVMLFALPVNHI